MVRFAELELGPRDLRLRLDIERPIDDVKRGLEVGTTIKVAVPEWLFWVVNGLDLVPVVLVGTINATPLDVKMQQGSGAT